VSLNRYAKKRDANEPELVKLLERLGGAWHPYGPLDGWAVFRGEWFPVEIKNPRGRNRLTPLQVDFIANAQARNAPVWVWRTEDDVYNCTGALRVA
jgi:hypothetical protein